MTFRFVSNVDGTDFAEAVHDLDPAETLFIVSSKTFTTLETMTNAHTARDWLLAGLKGEQAATAKHFVAVSTNAEEVTKFGIDTANHVRLLGLGRRTLFHGLGHWALHHACPSGRTISAPCMDGCHQMDEHFRTAPFERNLPVLMGLLSLWYNDFFGAQTVAVLPYEQYLKRFPAYLQQLTMESNGKHVTWTASPWTTTPGRSTVWGGEPGTNGQHSFYSADPSGDPTHTLRFHRVRPDPQPARPASPTYCWPMSSRRRRRLPSARPPSRSRRKARPTGSCRIGWFEGNRPSNPSCWTL